MDPVDGTSFLVIVAVAALAALIAGNLGPRIVVPVVVLEILLGIVVGPHVLGLAEPDDFITFFSNLGLGMLFFFAGYEIDFDRIKGMPLRLGVSGWLLSLVLAYSIGGILALFGVVLSLLFTGSAMATTAIGTLIPIVHDAGELRTRFGTMLLGAGAIGEFGPIMLITLAFSSQSAVTSAIVLVAFVIVALITARLVVSSAGRGWEALERTLESSGQLAIRFSVLAVFALAALASNLGLDLLLGGFVAGIIVRAALRGREVPIFESKLTAVGYGFLIPFFFVTSGLRFDFTVLTADPVKFLLIPLFAVLFLVVRGTPALVFYREALPKLRDRAALAFFSATELPLVVAITTIAVDEGHMRLTTATALVGAAIVSTAVFPIVALRLRSDPTRSAAAPAVPEPAG